jgi:hypothetical protein
MKTKDGDVLRMSDAMSIASLRCSMADLYEAQAEMARLRLAQARRDNDVVRRIFATSAIMTCVALCWMSLF